jgi:hypothetical protein
MNLLSALRARGALLACLVCVLFPLIGHAHNSSKGLSALKMTVLQAPLEADFAISFADLDSLVKLDKSGDEMVTKEEIQVALEQLKNLVRDEVEISFDGRRVMPVQITPVHQESNFEVKMTFAGDPPARVGIESKILRRLPPEHQEFVQFFNTASEMIAEKVLTPADIKCEHVLFDKKNAPTAAAGSTASEAPAVQSGFGRFMKMGVQHILVDEKTVKTSSGEKSFYMITDHVLFLLALLVICERFLDVVKIVTSFTVAHSITLGLAAANIISAPSRIVEPMIAATIIYVGIENLLKLKTLQWRWLIAFTFGLIHGLGFATAFKEMFSSGNFLLRLLSFNVGVEIGQILIAAVILPILWQLRKHPKFAPRWIPVTSIAIVLMGSWWLIERLRTAA